jgi:BMFP domain-containing protein YqiC
MADHCGGKRHCLCSPQTLRAGRTIAIVQPALFDHARRAWKRTGLDAKRASGRSSMTQTSNRFFDEIARLMHDAAGVAQGVRREVDTLFRTQAERWLQDLDLVKREEFEAVKDMARLAREENEALKARVAALEARLGQGGGP